MKQKQFSPLSVAETAVSLFAAEKGYLNDVEINKVVDFEAALLSYVNNEQAELMATINEKATITLISKQVWLKHLIHSSLLKLGNS